MDTWMWLIFAIFFEVAGTTSLKISYGLTKTLPTLLTVLFYCTSFYMLSISLKKMDVGLSYALWAGIGTACIAIIGVFYFGESMSIVKAISLAFIILGVIGLNLSGGVH